jgi:hypothetical protein
MRESKTTPRDQFDLESSAITGPIPTSNRFSIVQAPPRSSEAFIRRQSSVGHERGAYLPITISGNGNSVLQISRCSRNSCVTQMFAPP